MSARCTPRCVGWPVIPAGIRAAASTSTCRPARTSATTSTTPTTAWRWPPRSATAKPSPPSGAIVEKSTTTDVRDATMLAFARALRHVAEHREAAATEVIAEHVSAQPDDDRVADGRLRRLLAVAYVCDERVRRRWSCADARAVAGSPA